MSARYRVEPWDEFWRVVTPEGQPIALTTSLTAAHDTATSLALFRSATPMPAGLHVDPDCAAGKHRACGGNAWDLDADELTACSCDCHLPAPQEVCS